MSKDHVLPIGARKATELDAVEAFRAVREIAKEFQYQTALFGSTLDSGEGLDIDILCAAAFDPESNQPSEYSAGSVANEIIRETPGWLQEYHQAEDQSWAAFILVLENNTVLDCYIVGLAQEEESDVG